MHRPSFLRYNHSSQQRLGALKVFVALLDPQRRSMGAEVLDRKVLALLVGPPVEDGVVRLTPKRAFPNNRGEELLGKAEAPSLLFTVTKKMLTRIREWAKLVGLVGSGNQITERGIILQRIMGNDQVESVKRGRLSEHNPFRLTLAERLYFLYVLLEHDSTWPFLLTRLGKEQEHATVTSTQACKLMTLSFLDLMAVPTPSSSGAELLIRREMRELTVHMAKSLSLTDDRIPKQTSSARGPQRGPSRKRVANAIPQRNTADDQTIPRFENLVDLGFLSKTTGAEAAPEDSIARRLEWRYVVTPAVQRWVERAGEADLYDSTFLWSKFAQCAASALAADAQHVLSSREHVLPILELVETEYQRIHRLLGHTPLESLALGAMLQGLERGVICEMLTIHELFLHFKGEGRFGDHLKFASGNELDRMFIDIRPGFFERVKEHYAQQ